MLMVTFAGSLVDKKGVRVIMLAGQIIMGIAMLLASVTQALWQLSCFLFLAGICQSIAGPTGAKAVLLWFEPKERATAMGVKQAGIPAAGIVAGMILPPVASALSWRTAWAFVGVFLILSGALSFLLYRDPANLQQGQRTSAAKKAIGE